MLRKGDVLFVQAGDSVVSRGIEFFQNLDDWKGEERIQIDPDCLTHAILVLDENYYCEEDIKNGFQTCHISELPKDRIIWHCVLTDKNRKKIYDNYHEFTSFLEEQDGKRYDFRGIGRIALNILSLGFYRPPENNNYNVCSELIAAVFKKVKILHNVNSSLETVSMLSMRPIFKERKIYNA